MQSSSKTTCTTNNRRPIRSNPITAVRDGTILIVEYKGTHGWTDAQDDRDIGGLWAVLSGGKCRFVMVRNRDWGQNEAELD